MHRNDESILGHLRNLGDLLLWVGVRRHPSSVRRALTSSSQELLGQSLPNLVCSIRRVRRQGIVNFMIPIPMGCNFGIKSVKLMYFSKSLLLFSGAWFRQTNCMVIMTKEGSTKIVNFMTLWTGVLVLGRGYLSHIVKMHNSFKNLLYPKHR